MAFEQADIDALDDAIKGGELKVKYGDKEVTYRSLSEMREIRAMMQQEVGGASAPTTSLASFSRE